MLYFQIDPTAAETVVTGVASELTNEQHQDQTWKSRWDFKHETYAEIVATAATKFANDPGVTYIAVDSGPNVSPRFDVIQAPRVGDLVSKGFNGDYYPEGEIVKISGSLRRIETSTRAVFYRVRQSGAWRSQGTWSMVQGHHTDKNPSF